MIDGPLTALTHGGGQGDFASDGRILSLGLEPGAAD